MWDQQARKTLEENKDRTKPLNNTLVQKNYDILQMASSNPQNILEIRWNDKLKYLDFEEIRNAANNAGCKDSQVAINIMVDKGYYSATNDLQYLGSGRPLDLLHVCQMSVNESWMSSLQLMFSGVVVDAGELNTKAIRLAFGCIKLF